VIQVPHNTVKKPLITGPVVQDVDLLRDLAQVSDEFGFAVLWPYARGLHYNVPLAITDTMEALSATQNEYKIDATRIYAMGDCGGGLNALMLAAALPDKLAAIGLLNTTAHFKAATNDYWTAANDPLRLAINLKGIPIRLVHGEFFPHSPISQSYELLDRYNRLGINPELITLPGSSWWADRDPMRMFFEFFQGKQRASAPQGVNLAGGQLKYGAAYWLRLERLAKPTEIGEIRARFQEPNRILVETENIPAFEILPQKLLPDRVVTRSLSINLNGTEMPMNHNSSSGLLVDNGPACGWKAIPCKSPDVEGPVAHAFSGPFLLVEGTQGPSRERAHAARLLHEIEKAWLDNYYVSPLHKLDRNITSQDIVNKNLVLVGTADTNAVLKRISHSIPVATTRKGLRIGDTRIEGSKLTLVAVYPNPLFPKRYVVVITANDASAFTLSDPDLARAGTYDVSIWRNDAGNPPQLLRAGYWDDSWQHLLPEQPEKTPDQDFSSVDGAAKATDPDR
jgi:predicted esterase